VSVSVVFIIAAATALLLLGWSAYRGTGAGAARMRREREHGREGGASFAEPPPQTPPGPPPPPPPATGPGLGTAFVAGALAGALWPRGDGPDPRGSGEDIAGLDGEPPEELLAWGALDEDGAAGEADLFDSEDTADLRADPWEGEIEDGFFADLDELDPF
jgi:hypothetical protein